IAPDTPPVREVMTDEAEGLIIPAGAVDALKAALGRLAGNPMLPRPLRERFRERVLRQYTWDHAADRLLTICENARREATSGSRALRRAENSLERPALPEADMATNANGPQLISDIEGKR